FGLSRSASHEGIKSCRNVNELNERQTTFAITLAVISTKNREKTYEQQQRAKIGGKNCGYHGRKQRDWLGHSQALRGRRCARRDHRATRERAEGGRSLHQEKRYDGR